VIWEKFAPKHRPQRDDSGFGPFLFAIDQYKRAIAALSGEISALAP
jgi:hypothetical protein